MKDLVIQPQKEGKGRAFRATLVSYVRWRGVSPDGNDTIRPVHMTLAGTDNELRPFVANLRTGKKADVLGGGRRGDTFEILKSAGYQCTWQRTAKGTLVTLFAPDLFCLDPGMVDPKGVVFLVLPARGWLKPSTVPVPACVPEDRVEDVRALAPLFIAYLDRRTRCPLVPDPRFYVQVLANALDEGLASLPAKDRYRSDWGEGTWTSDGAEDVGLATGVAFCSSHERLEAFLAEQVKIFYGATSVAEEAA